MFSALCLTCSFSQPCLSKSRHSRRGQALLARVSSPGLRCLCPVWRSSAASWSRRQLSTSASETTASASVCTLSSTSGFGVTHADARSARSVCRADPTLPHRAGSAASLAHLRWPLHSVLLLCSAPQHQRQTPTHCSF